MNWTFWKRSKRTLATSGLLRDLTDCHSHLLPGVDDGVRSLGESLQILADMESAGIRKVWLTPHIMEDMPNTTERLRERFARLQDAYTGPVRLALAAEYMLDNLFAARLEGRDNAAEALSQLKARRAEASARTRDLLARLQRHRLFGSGRLLRAFPDLRSLDCAETLSRLKRRLKK